MTTNSYGSGWQSAIQFRELNYGGPQDLSNNIKPRIALHWGGVVASQIGVRTDGAIEILNNPGTGYENLIAREITAVGNLRSNNAVFPGIIASNGAGCAGLGGAVARDGANNLYICN